jgi:hypothetical protein
LLAFAAFDRTGEGFRRVFAALEPVDLVCMSVLFDIVSSSVNLVSVREPRIGTPAETPLQASAAVPCLEGATRPRR